MSRTGWAIAITSAILGLMYFAVLFPAEAGYGYYGHRSSFFYWSGGNSTVYRSTASNRASSTGGPRVSGRGPSGGK